MNSSSNMIKYVAFLRGINVGGNKLIKMADLREVFERSRFKNVRTYIQSGNVIFEAKETDLGALAAVLERKIQEAFGHEVKVLVQTVAELADIVSRNPFEKIESNDEVRMVVTFISAAPAGKLQLPLVFPKEKVEILALEKRALFVLCRRKQNGQFEFPNALIEKELGVSATTRNPTTVRKILELADKT